MELIPLHGAVRRRTKGRGRAGWSVGALVVLLAAIVALAGGFGWMYVKQVRQPLADNEAANRQRVMRMVGLAEQPAAHRLDPRFADADNDLVADPPTDPAQQVDPPTLFFSYIATEDAAAYRDAWQPFTDHLAKVTGKPVEYAMLTDSPAQLKAFAEGRLHVTGFNTGSVPQVVNAAGFVPVVKLPTDDGTGLSKMRIVVPAGSPIRSVADLRGHELTLTEPNSNSGFKAPIVALRSEFDLLPVRDYRLRYSGGHEASIAGIAANRYEAAAVADDMLARALSHGTVSAGQYRSIYESEKFPTAGLGYAYNLRPELAAKVREAFATFDWKGTPLEQQFGGVAVTKFVPVNYKDDWALIRRIDDASGQMHVVK